jgi:hypothetical protein
MVCQKWYQQRRDDVRDARRVDPGARRVEALVEGDLVAGERAAQRALAELRDEAGDARVVVAGVGVGRAGAEQRAQARRGREGCPQRQPDLVRRVDVPLLQVLVESPEAAVEVLWHLLALVGGDPLERCGDRRRREHRRDLGCVAGQHYPYQVANGVPILEASQLSQALGSPRG